MKTRNVFSLLALPVCLMILAGCSSTAYIEKDDQFRPENYKTFAWLPEKNKDNSLATSKIRSAVTVELEKNGWKEVKSRPDLILDFDILVENASRERREPVYTQPFSRVLYNPYTRRYITVYYPSRLIGFDSQQEQIREGTITVTMIESKTDKMVWQGWTTAQVNSRNLTSKEIQKAVNSIFRKFDIAKK